MPLCHSCSKSITGPYIEALGHTWHAACFRCAACGRVMGDASFLTHEHRPYHAGCYHEHFSPRCAGCGKPIDGAYITALGKHWHPEHFVCRRCGQPFRGKGFYEQDGKAYCQGDFEELFGKRCAAGGELIGQRQYFEKDGKVYCEEHYWQQFGKICAIGGEILKGDYLVNSWQETYCHAHARGLPECYSCGRLICQRLTGGGVRYKDDRHVCNRCRRTAIDTVPQGQPLLMQVRRFLAGHDLGIGVADTPLQMVDQAELNRRSRKPYSKKPAGMALHQSTTRNGQVIERRVEAILILQGLPAEHFCAIAAHELCHSYLFMNSYPDLPPVAEEGLCELAGYLYLWLRAQNTAEAQHRMALMDKNDDLVYGQGYRAACRANERTGLASLLDFVRRHSQLP